MTMLRERHSIGWMTERRKLFVSDEGYHLFREQIYNPAARELELVSLGRKQCALLEAQADAISGAVQDGSATVAHEIRLHADTISRELSQAHERLADRMGALGEEISDSLFTLGELLSSDLTDIKWLLAQQGRTLDAVLHVLSESRSNDARQLVEQGTRLLAVREYADAEERLRSALKADRTDYQVLMNLGVLDKERGNLRDALRWFKNAWQLPVALDPPARARALWLYGRVLYKQREFSQARDYANRAITADPPGDPGWVFTAGVYAILSGDANSGLSQIRGSILREPELFVRAGIDPDLNGVRERVFAMLEELSTDTSRRVGAAATRLVSQLETLRASEIDERHATCLVKLGAVGAELMSVPPDASFSVRTRTLWALQHLTATYKSLLPLLETASSLRKTTSEQRVQADALSKRMSGTDSAISTMAEQVGAIDEKTRGLKWLPTTIGRIAIIATYVGIGMASARAEESSADRLMTPWIMGVVWPLMFVLRSIGAVLGGKADKVFVGAVFHGAGRVLLVVGLLSTGAFVLLWIVSSVRRHRVASIEMLRAEQNRLRVGISAERDVILEKIAQLERDSAETEDAIGRLCSEAADDPFVLRRVLKV